MKELEVFVAWLMAVCLCGLLYFHTLPVESIPDGVKINLAFLVPFTMLSLANGSNVALPKQLAKRIEKTFFVNFFLVQVPVVWFLVFLFPLPRETCLFIFFSLLSFLIAVVCQEVFYYGLHRWAHANATFRRLHGMHHEIHEQNLTGLAALYAHPLDHLLLNLVPAVAGFVLMVLAGYSPTLEVVYLWSFLAGTTAALTHMRGIAWNKHSLHHLQSNRMFGSLGFLDQCFQTS
jgi:sterol desaturase/sphingolipid hydroxylase (fatty acid hydroxylase superfamily)